MNPIQPCVKSSAVSEVTDTGTVSSIHTPTRRQDFVCQTVQAIRREISHQSGRQAISMEGGELQNSPASPEFKHKFAPYLELELCTAARPAVLSADK